jgi:hypothetical protein
MEFSFTKIKETLLCLFLQKRNRLYSIPSENIKELLIFISDMRSLRDIDESIRFAVTNSIRDKMVLSILRDLVATMPEGEAREAVQEELNMALDSKGDFDKEDFVLKKKSREWTRGCNKCI